MQTRWRRLSVVLLVGCAAPPATPVDAAEPPDAALQRCDVPDRVCPAYAPAPGAPCDGDLACPYGREVSAIRAICDAGSWRIECVDAGCHPPIVEQCDAPFTTAIPGATLTLGPPSENRPYADGELVTEVIGPQGLAMIPYALRIGGTDLFPECIEHQADVTITSSGSEQTFPFDVRTMHLYCGASRAAYWNPPLRCGDATATITVHVTGLGDAHARITVRHPDC